MAERDNRLPPGLLGAIGRVESGRSDGAGGVSAWPWTINAEGQGRYFPTKEDAIAAVEELRARGVTLIDVGCMQVNLFHHPRAFASLEDAFDPVINTRYAGLYLTRLYAQSKDWEIAAGNYHSFTAEHAEPYRAKVMMAWQGTPGTAGSAALDLRTDALAAAWRGAPPLGPLSIGGNGFQVVALSNFQRPGDTARGRATMLVITPMAYAASKTVPAPTRIVARPVPLRGRLNLEIADAGLEPRKR